MSPKVQHSPLIKPQWAKTYKIPMLNCNSIETPALRETARHIFKGEYSGFRAILINFWIRQYIYLKLQI